MSDHEHIREDDLRALQRGEKILYDLFVEDLTILGQVLNRDTSCCSASQAKLYGHFRYQVALDRYQSIRSLLEWMVSQFIKVDVQHDIMQLQPTVPASSYLSRYLDSDSILLRNSWHGHMQLI